MASRKWPTCPTCKSHLCPTPSGMACPTCPLNKHRLVRRPRWCTIAAYTMTTYPESRAVVRRPGQPSLFTIEERDGLWWRAGGDRINLSGLLDDREAFQAANPSFVAARISDSRGMRVEWFKPLAGSVPMSQTETMACADTIESLSANNVLKITDGGRRVSIGGKWHEGLNLVDALRKARGNNGTD